MAATMAYLLVVVAVVVAIVVAVVVAVSVASVSAEHKIYNTSVCRCSFPPSPPSRG